ncbi:STAS-like domain-containing protein [Segatella bryantii]|uniref:STAS-like domain-containing protein n=1 Tax=Segatella bryantii TaxID=77095 RepID=UPI002430A090|nr:STAS-like domain-containing protein [Segatella bryantii]
MITVSIAKDFSRIPGARFPQEGDHSGQEFRTKVLLPKLREAIAKKEKLCVILDGTAGLGTSFLEEAFGGLIREDKIPYEELQSIIELVSEEDEDYIEEINQYIKDAYKQKNNH